MNKIKFVISNYRNEITLIVFSLVMSGIYFHSHGNISTDTGREAIIPMALLRPISGTASLAIMNDVFANLGPDSFAGKLASVLQGCTDTTVYVIALYYGSVKISKIGHSLSVGLFADLVGIIMAFVITILFF